MGTLVVVTAFPLPEDRADVLAAMEVAIPQFQQEPGCELCALHDSGDRLVVIEKWSDEPSMVRHSQSDAFQQFLVAVDGKFASELEVRVLIPRPVGSALKGTV